MRNAFLFFPPACVLALGACAGEPADTVPETVETQSESASEPSGDPSGDASSPASGEPAPAPDNTASGDTSINVAESGWLTIGNDGAVQQTYFDADGRYRDLRNGELFGEGNWEQRPGGSICFEPDTGRGACWDTNEADKNGEAIVTNGDGKVIEIRQITYIAPPDDEEDAGD